MTLLRPDYDWYNNQASRLQSVAGSLAALNPLHQKIIAEVLLLRLFDLLVSLMVVVATKVSQGSVYLDGTSPTLLVSKVRSKQAAITQFKNLGRTSPKQQLRWTIPQDIHDNVAFVIAPSDNLRQVITRHATSIDEMRRVRNRIAHNNPKARQQFQIVIRQYYGATLNHLTPGTLLLTDRWQPQRALLSQYFVRAGICAKELVRK